MGKVLAQFSLTMLVTAGSMVLLSNPLASAVNAADFRHPSAVDVTDHDGYFIVTLGKVQLIFVTDAGSG